MEAPRHSRAAGERNGLGRHPSIPPGRVVSALRSRVALASQRSPGRAREELDALVTAVTTSLMARILWVALSYRLPREPSRLRLAVWRRLKRIGAAVLHDSVWLLPADAKTREAFEWLAEEIEEQGGTALIWEAASFDSAQDDAIVAQFRAEADERYAAIAESADALRRLAGRRRSPGRARLEQARRQLAGLERALRLESRRDHFRALGRRVATQELELAAQALGRAGGSAAAESESPGGRANAVGH